jgi:hypothetical protein
VDGGVAWVAVVGVYVDVWFLERLPAFVDVDLVVCIGVRETGDNVATYD